MAAVSQPLIKGDGSVIWEQAGVGTLSGACGVCEARSQTRRPQESQECHIPR
jgi:hypothetical protein